MKVKIDIDTRTFVRFWLVVIGFGVAGFALYSARTALIIVGSALFLALALNAPVSKLAKILPGHSRVGGTALSYVAVVAFLAAVVFLVIPPIFEQTAKFAQTVPNLVDTATQQWKGVNTLVDTYNLRGQVDNAVNSLKDNATGWAANIGSNVVASVGSLFSLLTATLLVLVLSFLMLIEGPQWMRRIWSLYSNNDRMERDRRVVQRMHAVVSGYVVGQLTVSAIGATAAGLAVFVISFVFPAVPANLAMPTAAIAFTLSLIPVFGTTIAGVIISVLLLLNSVPAAVAFVVFFVLYQQIENNFISPTIQSRRIELSALAILVSVTIGLYVFGIAGGLISIPIAGCIKVLIEEYLVRAKNKRVENDKPIAKLVKKIKNTA